MNRLFRTIATIGLALSTALLADCAEAKTRFVADYTVFVDPPTGFVFVKLPAGWKFAGKVDAGDLTRLPASVVTTLLVDSGDEDETASLAGKPITPALPR